MNAPYRPPHASPDRRNEHQAMQAKATLWRRVLGISLTLFLGSIAFGAGSYVLGMRLAFDELEQPEAGAPGLASSISTAMTGIVIAAPITIAALLLGIFSLLRYLRYRKHVSRLTGT